MCTATERRWKGGRTGEWGIRRISRILIGPANEDPQREKEQERV